MKIFGGVLAFSGFLITWGAAGGNDLLTMAVAGALGIAMLYIGYRLTQDRW